MEHVVCTFTSRFLLNSISWISFRWCYHNLPLHDRTEQSSDANLRIHMYWPEVSMKSFQILLASLQLQLRVSWLSRSSVELRQHRDSDSRPPSPGSARDRAACRQITSSTCSCLQLCCCGRCCQLFCFEAESLEFTRLELPVAFSPFLHQFLRTFFWNCRRSLLS